MKFTEIFVKRPVTTIMIMLIVILLGVVSLSGISWDLLPEIELPMAGVITVYPGSSPTEVEELVTKPLETELSTVNNLDSVNSISQENMSIVMFKFNWGVNVDEAAIELRDKLELVKANLPSGIQTPTVIKFDPTLMPTMELAVSDGKSIEDLTKIINDTIKPDLEKVPGVASVELIGGLDSEIKIQVDQEKMSQAGLSYDQLLQVLKSQNLSIPAGEIEKDNKKMDVRATASIDNIDQIKDIIVGYKTANLSSSANQVSTVSASYLSYQAIPQPVYLKDIAEVDCDVEETTSINKLNDQKAVGLSIRKEGSANTVKVSNEVKEKIDRIQEENNVDIAIIMNQAEIVENSINNVAITGIIGAIIAIIILFFFLKDIGSALIVGISIPFSVIATFALMYASGISMNLMSLGGLVLGIGMLVDNSIVVLENIYRHFKEKGKTAFQAAIEGTKEVAGAITASTLTTLAVFLPVVFLGGLAGQLFKDFSLTIVFSLSASLLVALTILPMLASKFMKKNNARQAVKENKLLKIYEPIIKWSLKNRFAVIVIAIGLLAGSIALIPAVGTELIPDIDQGYVAISAKLPNGTKLEKSEELAEEIEVMLLDYEEISNISANIGSDSQNMASIMGDSGNNIVKINAKLKAKNERDISTDEFVKEVKSKLEVITGGRAESSIAKTNAMMDIGTTIEYKISGNDDQDIKKISDNLVDKIKNINGLINVSSDISEQKPEIEILVDNNKAMSQGLVPAQVINAVYTTTGTTKVMEIEKDDDIMDVNIELRKEDKASIDDLKQLELTTTQGKKIKLEEVAEIKDSLGPVKITRENQSRTATISASLNDTSLSKADSQIQEIIDSLEIPSGLEITQSGIHEMQDESFDNIYIALIFAAILVYMIMAAQFERLLHPFIIMFCIPLALIGAILGLLMTNIPLGITAMIGFVVLVGIVINNGIVLVTYVEQLQEKGMSKEEALIEGGKTRLRPILMTAITTIVGLIPLALNLGEGSEMMKPVAIVVIGGMITSTLLTLIVIPVVYSLLDRKKTVKADSIQN